MSRIAKMLSPVAAVLLLLLTAMTVSAQRRVTPVTPSGGGVQNTEKTEVDRSRLAEKHDANGNIILVDTVTGKEFVDTTAMIPMTKMIYPLMDAVTVGVNIWDPAMRLFGQKYGLGDVWAELSLHNRYKPVFEAGIGMIDDTPSGNNYTFKSGAAPYFKIGMNYNFLYNSTPDYQVYAGIRYGFTSFKWKVENVTVTDQYWDEVSHITIDPGKRSSAGYFELVAGIKVKIGGPWSLGWALRYHSILHESDTPFGKSMYIPGYGKRNGAITGSFSIMYTLPLNKPAVPEVDISDT